MFSKATPAADASKLKPGVALPHVTLPTTEASAGRAGAEGSRAASSGSRAGSRAAAAELCHVRGADNACLCTAYSPFLAVPCALQGGRVEIGAPTGRWQLVVVYRGKHDPLCVTYLAALQVGWRDGCRSLLHGIMVQQ